LAVYLPHKVIVVYLLHNRNRGLLGVELVDFVFVEFLAEILKSQCLSIFTTPSYSRDFV